MARFLTSSIGKKFVQSVSGAFLVIFLLLHGTINFFSVIDSLHGNFGKVAEDAVRFSKRAGVELDPPPVYYLKVALKISEGREHFVNAVEEICSR